MSSCVPTGVTSKKKQSQGKSKGCRWKEVIKIEAETNEMETKRMIMKLKQSAFFEKQNKIEKVTKVLKN